jgi:hypothetical protein
MDVMWDKELVYADPLSGRAPSDAIGMEQSASSRKSGLKDIQPRSIHRGLHMSSAGTVLVSTGSLKATPVAA